jgi:hypothetical protein
VQLGWRLAATSEALAAGVIDVYRARLIAEATGTLPDAAARAVEERVLAKAGEQTPGMTRLPRGRGRPRCLRHDLGSSVGGVSDSKTNEVAVDFHHEYDASCS